jgi:2-polyprenyl-3-methyl-5-hydroxy-6-metoxy-1,4-benzoquinol methylase
MSLSEEVKMENSQLGWDPQKHYKDTKIAEQYDSERFNSIAGQFFNFLEKRNIKRAFAGVPSGATVVDVPCGTGRLAEALLEQGYKVVGVDISEAMLKVAEHKLRRFGNQFEIATGDAFKLKELGRRFDAALCARVLMHFPLDQQALFLKGIKEVTDGPIVFTQSVITPYQRVRHGIKKLIGSKSKVAYPLTPSDLRSLLNDAGLDEVAMHSVAPLISEARAIVSNS